MTRDGDVGRGISRRGLLARGAMAGAGAMVSRSALASRLAQAAAGAGVASGAQAAAGVGVAGGYPQPGRNPYPYPGVSGPGYPVDAASGHGGWRSGSAGVAYLGEHPPAYKTLPWENYASGSAVKAGLIPAIVPLVEAQVRDTVVCRGGDGQFYMTGSTGGNIWAFNDGVELWRSPDLKRWSYMGLVWTIERDGTWERQWRPMHDMPTRAIWAPEIHFIRGNYVICLSMAPQGISILKSKTGRPEGPYVHAFSAEKPIVNAIDPTLFEDDDGKVYFTFSSATRIVRLKDDLSGLAEDYRPVVLTDPDHTPSHHAAKCAGRGMNDLGTEGAVLFKANGRYYLGAADDYEGRYSTCLAMSDTIYGPYHTRHESVPCGGGTGFFEDGKGGWWSSYFGNDTQTPFREKPAIVKVDFAKDGRVVVAAAAAGKKA